MPYIKVEKEQKKHLIELVSMNNIILKEKA